MNTTEDIKIIDLLFERNESGLSQIEAKYKNLYKSILAKLLSNGEDVEECENDVLLAVWNSIPPNRPENLSAYICKIARNVSINKFKYNTRTKRSKGYITALEELSECIPDKAAEGSFDKKAEQKEISEAISDFLRGMDAETRILFIRRYFYLESVTELSKRYGISENRISVKLFRTRAKLHKYLEKEGIFI
ncbi:MAG: sigma-70 family RNA polymerase sigma factor [Clostridia bacterium]|nr:sigma-70 family RNA polymerase sigma factor [Clostridia bacterium]